MTSPKQPADLPRAAHKTSPEPHTTDQPPRPDTEPKTPVRDALSPPGHAPGGGEIDRVPDEAADKVAPRDPRETQTRDPGSKPWPDELDRPDAAGDRPRPL